MRIIDRLLEYLTFRRITAYSFERNCKVANGYLKKQYKGKGSIGSDILERIYENYFDINLVWLITGEGEMLVPSQEGNEGNTVREPRPHYSKDEQIKALTERIQHLETYLQDKEKIIRLMEANKLPSPTS